MKTTIDSTGLDDQQRARRLPPDLLHRTNILLDELERSRVELQRLQPMVPNPDHARACRTNAIEALVLMALDNATLRADMLRVNHAFRTSKVIDHLNYFKEDHGDVKKRYDIKKAPSRAKVRAILQQHGYVPF